MEIKNKYQYNREIVETGKIDTLNTCLTARFPVLVLTIH